MTDPIIPPGSDKSIAQLREEFSETLVKAKELQRQLADLTRELTAHGFVYKKPDPAMTDTVEF